MNRVTRQRTLWTTIYRRSMCPLPTLDQSLPVARLERTIGRAEFLDTKWTNPHPTISNVLDSLTLLGVVTPERDICVGISGPYAVFLRHDIRHVAFHWYKIVGDVAWTSLNPIYQHHCVKPPNADFPSQSTLDDGLSYEMDHETGVLYIASVSPSGEDL